jgi:PAS domain S-box-containing protein
MNDMSRVTSRDLSGAGLAGAKRVLEVPPAFLELLPLAVYTCDAEKRLLSFNRRAADIWGNGLQIGARLNESVAIDEILTAVLESGTAVHDKEVSISRADGFSAYLVVHVDPVKDEGGGTVGAVVCLDWAGKKQRDKTADKTQPEDEHLLREVLEAIPVPVYTTDRQGRLTFYNKAAVEFAGHEPLLGIDQWCMSWRLYTPEGEPLPHDQCPMAAALKEGRAIRGTEAIAERPDGTRVPFLPFPTPLRDAQGNITGGINMLVDISDRKRAEERQRTMVDELNHRVKNTLATVQSLAAQTLRAPKVSKDVRGAFEARLFALSRTHDHLTRTHWQSADFKNIVQDIFMPFRYLGANRVRLKGASVEIATQAAMTLSMILHELATNASKYGALLEDSGFVEVSWHTAWRNSERRMIIEWQESEGPPVDEPLFKGFGSRLLESGVRQSLKGDVQIAYDRLGVRCVIDLPFPAVDGL